MTDNELKDELEALHKRIASLEQDRRQPLPSHSHIDEIGDYVKKLFPPDNGLYILLGEDGELRWMPAKMKEGTQSVLLAIDPDDPGARSN